MENNLYGKEIDIFINERYKEWKINEDENLMINSLVMNVKC